MTRLLIFPFAMGGASRFRNFVSMMEDRFEVVTFNYPGHESRFNEPLLPDIRNMAEDAYKKLNTYWNDDYILLGYSMGGFIIYELYRLLYRNGRKLPRHMYFLASEPPRNGNGRIYDNISIADVRNELIKLDGTPDEILENEDFLEIFTPVVKNDLSAISSYKVIEDGTKLEIPITVLAPIDEDGYQDHRMEWRKYCDLVAYIEVEGGHFFLFSEINNQSAWVREIVSNSLLQSEVLLK